MTTATIALVLKWIAQALVAVVGVWGLFSEPFLVDPETGKKSLGAVGWLKIALLGLGFALGPVGAGAGGVARGASSRLVTRLAPRR